MTLPTVRIETADCMDVLRTLPDGSVHCCVTSPPYFGLRDYGHAGQIGLEPTPEVYVTRLVDVFREVRRVLRADGTLWLNLGDSYASMLRSGRDESPGVGAKQEMPPVRTAIKWKAGGGNKFAWTLPGGQKPKDLLGIPWRVAFALQSDGWYLRSDIIWHKPNPMPESVTDRPTKAHEYLFLLSKSARYYYDAAAIAEPSTDPESLRPEGRNKRNGDAFTHSDPDGFARTRVGFAKLEGACYPTRNKRTVWTVPTSPYAEAHFATFPPALIEPCVRAGCPLNGTVLDPFAGSGTTGMVALQNGRSAILIELNPAYRPLIEARCAVTPAML